MTAPEGSDAAHQSKVARRELLLARQAEQRRQQQHDDAVDAFARWHGAYLQQAGVRHAVHWDPPARSPLSGYPIGFASVDWDRVPEAIRSDIADEGEIGPLVAAALSALAVAQSRELWIDWGVSTMPWLAMAASDVPSHATELSRWSSDLWIYDPKATWLIEILHDGQFAYAPDPAPE
jgi:hypothetical protein